MGFFFFFLLVMGFFNQAYSSFARLSPYTGLLFSDSYQFYIPNFIFQTEFSESQHCFLALKTLQEYF